MDKTSYTNLAKMWELAEDRAFSHQSEDMNAVRRHAEESGSPQGSAQQAELLNLLVRIIGAASVIAVGTGSVVETLQLVKGLEGRGQLTAVDSSAQGIGLIRSLFTQLDDVTQTTLRAVNAPVEVFLPRLNAGTYQFIAVCGEAGNYAAAFEQAPRLLGEHGMIVFTDVMALESSESNGGVLNPADRSDKAVAMRIMLDEVQSDERFISTFVPVGTGMLIAVKN
ncbi:O-methyltransferase [Bifidobacterium tibiigranuli]|jgi:predicted O-methyltransferase YrrM|uniref:O-methyltransferase n=1 Tax=Bifidobacterium tibiigranuli TaxID=2172043 RepID=UPI0026EE88CB|nr:methyltransferase [Bifidobacterium tibiigranuli]MCI2185736.1 methyltransferase [Bifidobacterium tibiigranuli]MCI2203047.1 methyltransferase [Bifidobacterium tibiigranuli]